MVCPPSRGLVSPCLPLSPHMCACVGWCVRLPKGLVSTYIPLSPLVSGRSRAGEVRHYGRQYPWVRGHTQGPSSVFAALGTDPLQRIPWLVWLEMLLRWLCLPLSSLVSPCLPLSPTVSHSSLRHLWRNVHDSSRILWIGLCSSMHFINVPAVWDLRWSNLTIPANTSILSLSLKNQNFKFVTLYKGAESTGCLVFPNFLFP